MLDRTIAALAAAEAALAEGHENCGCDDSIFAEPLRLVRIAILGAGHAAPALEVALDCAARSQPPADRSAREKNEAVRCVRELL